MSIKEYEKMFWAEDEDHSGFLTSDELKSMLKKRGYKLDRKELKEQMDKFDIDGDNKVSLNEYLIYMGKIPEVIHLEANLRKTFKVADKNGDGLLDIEELCALFRQMEAQMEEQMDPEMIVEMVQSMDKDKSGKMDYKEFLSYFLKEKGYL